MMMLTIGVRVSFMIPRRADRYFVSLCASGCAPQPFLVRLLSSSTSATARNPSRASTRPMPSPLKPRWREAILISIHRTLLRAQKACPCEYLLSTPRDGLVCAPVRACDRQSFVGWPSRHEFDRQEHSKTEPFA